MVEHQGHGLHRQRAGERERIEGVSEVGFRGAGDRELRIVADPARMASRGITYGELVARLREENGNFSGGKLPEGKADVRVRSVGRFSDVRAVEEVVLRRDDAGQVLVRDVAEVHISHKERTDWVRARGHLRPFFNFQLEKGANLLETMSGIDAEIVALNAPGGLLEREARRRFGDGDLRGLWESRFGRGGAGTGAVAPTLTHDPQVAFILADFNAGFAACRIAAPQVALNAVDGAGLAVDGKMGPKTREAMFTFFEGHVRRERDRKELRQLVEEGRKRLWVIKHTGRLARDIIRRTEHRDLPQALVPDLSYESTSQTLKGIGRTSVARYAAASARFFEGYYRRLSDYTGRGPRRRTGLGVDPGGPFFPEQAPGRGRTVPERR